MRIREADVCISGSKKYYFLGKLRVRTLWMVLRCFVDASMMHLKAVVFAIFRGKSWFALATNYIRKCVRKPSLANPGTRFFKNFSLVQTVVVPPWETNESKLLSALFIFISSPSLKVWRPCLNVLNKFTNAKKFLISFFIFIDSFIQTDEWSNISRAKSEVCNNEISLG